jgi:hypothetical protein
VISDLLNRFTDHTVCCEPLVNFQLIASGEPFDYLYATKFDAIVYSPIRNKADYNTAALDEFCSRRGIQAIRYPWLEWHGTFPNVRKASFLGFHEWVYRIEDFTRSDPGDKYSRPSLEPSMIAYWFNMTTDQFRAHEEVNAVNVPVIDFILQHYRTTPMFQSPDHPTLFVYRHVVAEIARRLGIELLPAFYHYSEEPQQDVRLPILPEVIDALGLQYEQPLCRDRRRFGEIEVPVDEYLRILSVKAPFAQFTARHDCFAKLEAAHADTLSGDAKISLPAHTQVIGELVNANETTWHHEVRLHLMRGHPRSRLFAADEPLYHLYAEDFTLEWLEPNHH